MKNSAMDKEERKNRIMEACFDCYCRHGLNQTGMKALGEACGMNHSSFYNYFDSLDELIVQSTAHCMEGIANEYVERALSYCPRDGRIQLGTVIRLMREMPRWAADTHGAKYRFMYQVYSSPKYLEHGRAFFADANRRYAECASKLAPKIGVSYNTMEAVVLVFARAAVHYAMFEDESSLNLQIDQLIALLQTQKDLG